MRAERLMGGEGEVQTMWPQSLRVLSDSQMLGKCHLEVYVGRSAVQIFLSEPLTLTLASSDPHEVNSCPSHPLLVHRQALNLEHPC